MKALLLTKTTPWCDAAASFTRLIFPEVKVVQAERGVPMPIEVKSWRGDYLLSFLSSWVVPGELLERAGKAALNFHPGPPEYPGTGCYNFALYDEALQYGVTCHHMAAKVDTGAIVAVRRFPIFARDTVVTLKERSMVYLLELYYEVVQLLSEGTELPRSKEAWTKPAYLRRQLDALCRITPEMSPPEVRRRIRATYCPGYPGPFVEIAGAKFEAGGGHV